MAWYFVRAAAPSFAPDQGSALLVAVGGSLASILLWAVAWFLTRLRETEAGFRYLFEKNPNPMWVFDRGTLEIIEVNDAATEQYGYSHEEFRRMRITDLRPADDVPKLQAYMQNRLPGLKGSGEWRHFTKDGRMIDVEVVSFTLEYRNRPAVLVVVRDISDSKRAEAALKESEAAARGVLDTALDAYVRMDAEGRITEWNRMAEKTFGWDRDEIFGHSLADVMVPPDQREAHRRGLARYLATGEGPLLNRRIEVQALHRNGTRFPVELTILAVQIGRTRSFSAFLRDLTDKKALDAQLRQAQKMEAIGQLTGGIAHDFNNLLTVIIGNLELFNAAGSADPESREAVTQALLAAEKSATLTHRLLAFARQQPLQPVRTELNEMIGDMKELLRRTLGENIEIEVRPADNLWPELADKSQLESALLNLAINARDAMPQGGKLTIETGNVSLDADYASRNAEVEPGDYVMLAVTDTGTGMAPEVVEQAFDPFFTTKASGKGSGLGLSMIYGFAKQSGGHLKIYSEMGHGTTVKLYLPRAIGHQPEIAPEDESALEYKGSETVLVVEDEAPVRTLVAGNLRSLGYRVLDAADGPAAIALLRSDEPIDLLFTDVVLPGGISGRELAEEARTLRPAICVLFTSGYTQNSIIHQGKLDAGVHLLSKPYRRADLGRKVREVLEASRDN